MTTHYDPAAGLFRLAARLDSGEHIDPTELLDGVRTADRLRLPDFASSLADVLERQTDHPDAITTGGNA